MIRMPDGDDFFITPRSRRLATETGLVRDEIPAELGNRVASVLVTLDNLGHAETARIHDMVWRSMGGEVKWLTAFDTQKIENLQQLLANPGSLTQFLDATELAVKAADQMGWELGYLVLRGGIDEAFLLSRFGYRFVGTDIVEAGSDIENVAIDEARATLLADSRFADAEEKFVSALVKLTSNRDTDYPEAVHAAVSATEEVCREILHDPSASLGPALEKLRQRCGLDANVVAIGKKLYDIRGNTEGAAHGAGPGSESLARFAVHSAAALMVLLVSECASA